MAPDPDDLRPVVETIAARLRAGVPTLTAVEHHPGILSAGVLGRAATRAPCAHLTVTAITAIERGRGIETPTWRLRLRLGLSLVTRDTVANGVVQLSRQDQAVDLIAALALVVASARWEDPALGVADAITARNVHDQVQDVGGIQAWSLTWSQTWTVTGDRLDGTVLPALFLGRAPDIGPPHIDDYALVAAAVPETPA